MEESIHNKGMTFDKLDEEDRKTFRIAPLPLPVRFENGNYLYKLTQYELRNDPETGFLTAYWLPWEGIKAGDQWVPGIHQLSARYGGLAQFREFIRARNAVNNNALLHLKKIQLRRPTIGIVGVTGPQLREGDAKVSWIGGDYQVCIPGMRLEDVLQH